MICCECSQLVDSATNLAKNGVLYEDKGFGFKLQNEGCAQG